MCFEQNTTIINQYVSQNTGIIKDIKVSGEVCTVTLNNGKTMELAVYDTYARIRDRVQSIVLIPNAKGHITHFNNWDYVELNYLVTPASMAKVIADKASQGGVDMGVEVEVVDGNGFCRTESVGNVYADADGRLTLSVLWLKNEKENSKALALHVYDKKEGATDYLTTFTPIDWSDY